MESRCMAGYIGPLCQSCGLGYAKYDGKKCEICYKQEVEYLFVILTTMAFVIFNLILLKYNI